MGKSKSEKISYKDVSEKVRGGLGLTRQELETRHGQYFEGMNSWCFMNEGDLQNVVMNVEERLESGWLERWKAGDDSVWAGALAETGDFEHVRWPGRMKAFGVTPIDVVKAIIPVVAERAMNGQNISGSESKVDRGLAKGVKVAVEELEIRQPEVIQVNWSTLQKVSGTPGEFVEAGVAGKKVNVGGDSGPKKDHEIKSEILDGMSIYEKLEQLMNKSSGGKDCVPDVVTWMLALVRSKKGNVNLLQARDDVSRDMVNLRRNGGDDHFVPKGGGGWVTTIRYQNALFENGRLGEHDGTTLVDINGYNSVGRAGDQSETVLEKLRTIDNSVRDTGKFEMENLDTHPKYLKPGQLPEKYKFDGKPVFAIKTNLRMDTTVIINNPNGEFFTQSQFEHVGQCPRIGETWELIGQHEVLLVDYSNDLYRVIDPQTGMLLEVNSNEFKSRVEEGKITFDKGICV